MSVNDWDNFLDVEDDEQRQHRIGSILEQLNTSPSSSIVSPKPILNIGHERSLGPVEPPTELLSRVRAFLPAISASNQTLSQMKPEDIDIENIPEDEEQYIEMNLGLGVFEAKHRPGSSSPSPSTEADSGSDSTSSGSESHSESFRASSEEDSESASSSSPDYDSDLNSQSGSSVDMRPVFSRLIRPLPRRQTKTEV